MTDTLLNVRRKIMLPDLDTMITYYPRLISSSGWLLVVAGCLAIVAALLGIVTVLYAASGPGIRHSDEQLVNVHYVIQPHWSNAWPFGLCLVLAVILVFVGYRQTKTYATRIIQLTESGNIEPNAPPGAAKPSR